MSEFSPPQPEATKALDRVEEERDEAFAAIAQWEVRWSRRFATRWAQVE